MKFLIRKIGSSNFKSMFYSGLMHLTNPLLLLLATPILLSHLGAEKYGVWIFIQTVLSFLHLMQSGLGDASIKFISKYRVINDVKSINKTISTTSSIFIIFAVLASLLLFVSADFISEVFMKESTDDLNLIFKLASMGLFFSFLLQNNLAILKGFERYDISSKIMILYSVLINLTSIFIVVVLKGDILLLVIGLVVNICIIFSLSLFIIKYKIKIIRYSFVTNLNAYKEIFSFSFYTWLQGLAGIVFSQGDKIIITWLFGPNILTYYTVALQIASQIHGFVASVFSFIYPLVSKVSTNNNLDEAKKIYFLYTKGSTLLSVFLGLIIYIYSYQILDFWLGEDIANEAYLILKILSASYTVMAIGAIPYYFLNGFNYVKLNTLIEWLNGIVILIGILLFPLKFGVIGIALARLLNIPISMITRTILHYLVLNDRRWYLGIVYIFLIITPFLFFGIFEKYYDTISVIQFIMISFVFIFLSVVIINKMLVKILIKN